MPISPVAIGGFVAGEFMQATYHSLSQIVELANNEIHDHSLGRTQSIASGVTTKNIHRLATQFRPESANQMAVWLRQMGPKPITWTEITRSERSDWPRCNSLSPTNPGINVRHFLCWM